LELALFDHLLVYLLAPLIPQFVELLMVIG